MDVKSLISLAVAIFAPSALAGQINREAVVSQFNPVRHASSNSTPLQVGNGDFAFGVDVTGLQTFQPFGTLSSWGWHNFSLPSTKNQTRVEDFTGLDWDMHGRLVNYNQPNPAESVISTWLIQNPQRLNLGRIGFWFNGQNITEASLTNKLQTLDLYSGTIVSSFSISGSKVVVETLADPNSDTVVFQVHSDLIRTGKLGVFFDYPYPDLNKFDQPFVGVWNATSKHTTNFQATQNEAEITHAIDTTSYYTTIRWNGEATVRRPSNLTHRYILQPKKNHIPNLNLVVNFSPTRSSQFHSATSIKAASEDHWESYWKEGAFIDLTTSKNASGTEIQRRIILSQYLCAINGAGSDPPQESGLVNNGWYGKFHMEMVFWHLAHWGRWGRWPLMQKSVPGVYNRFMETSKQQSRDQGYAGARWPKMVDASGRSAPGEINSLIIWQQPHPMYFAEMEWRDNQRDETLERWDDIISQTADWMVSFAWWNSSTGFYDLGPPMYPVSENTNPNASLNPTFEIHYWRFALNIAMQWKERQALPVPKSWALIYHLLAPLPIVNHTSNTSSTATPTYSLYEGIPKMWVDPVTFTDHPAMIGIAGWLPPEASTNLTIVHNTALLISQIWDFKNLYGWDFPMLAMNAVRIGEIDLAVRYLLDENFAFDDAGMSIGGPRVPTPYFPGNSALLFAVAMMAGGWDGGNGGIDSRWPKGWEVRAEGFTKAM